MNGSQFSKARIMSLMGHCAVGQLALCSKAWGPCLVVKKKHVYGLKDGGEKSDRLVPMSLLVWALLVALNPAQASTEPRARVRVHVLALLHHCSGCT